MISSPIIHPPILHALAAAGHRSTILIADAHYAAATAVGSRATVAYLNFTAGTPLTTDVIETLIKLVPVEKHTSMGAPDQMVPAVQVQISAILGGGVIHEEIARHDFYAMARSDDLALCIVTGDTRRFANAILTVGVNAD